MDKGATVTREVDRAGKAGFRVLAPGRNCWRVERTRHAAMLIDAAAYFACLEAALRRARRSIMIAGWDFDGDIRLRREDGTLPLGRMLHELADARPDLEIRILVWSVAVLHAPGDALPLLFGDDWQEHPRIQLHLDTRHPIYGAQHQKIVCIDDSLAFAGGIDLTVERWDTPAHVPMDDHRLDHDGEPYGPVHDMQMAVDGDAARALGDILRHRWKETVGETVAPVEARDAWPGGLVPDFTDAMIAIARTAPAWGGQKAVHEVARLTTDMLSAARRSIYIEAQYLASSEVGDVLGQALAREDGPEIIIVTTRTLPGLLERFAMGSNRDRMIRRLKRIDRFDRLRVYHPVVDGPDGECDILIHAKLVIVDDDVLRVGSSNLNNRSAGLDSECDLAIEATGGNMRRAIAGIRERLLAEHLGTTPDAVAAEDSLLDAVERLNGGPRRLRRFAARNSDGPTRVLPGTWLLDPRRPFDPLWFLHRRRRR